MQLSLFERGLIDLGLSVTSATGFGEQIAQNVKSHTFDVALLDYDLGPGPSGLDIARFIRDISPSTRLILITSFLDVWAEEPAMEKSSFFALINKRELTTLEKFKLRLSPLVTQASEHFSSFKLDEEFSATVLQIWRLVALGQTNAEIAKNMSLSVKSIEKVIHQLSSTLGISRDEGNLRVNLVRKYVERNGQLPSK